MLSPGTRRACAPQNPHYLMPPSNRSELVLSLKNVDLGYGDFTVLRGIGMDIHAGQVVAIMGGSGSGKTTLLRAATGQIAAQAGSVQVFGQELAGLPASGL